MWIHVEQDCFKFLNSEQVTSNFTKYYYFLTLK